MKLNEAITNPNKVGKKIEGKTIESAWQAALGFIVRFEDTSRVVFSATHGNMSVEYTN